MADRPIIFSGEMVRAILDGRKTQTRRICKDMIPPHKYEQCYWDGEIWTAIWSDGGQMVKCPYGVVGDRLWVRETAKIIAIRAKDSRAKQIRLEYKVDCKKSDWIIWPDRLNCDLALNKSLPRGTYKEAARLWLEITEIRVERLQDISEADIKREGVRPCLKMDSFSGWRYEEITPEELNPRIYGPFISLWNRLNSKRGYSWESNPWVWIIEFSKVEDGD